MQQSTTGEDAQQSLQQTSLLVLLDVSNIVVRFLTQVLRFAWPASHRVAHVFGLDDVTLSLKS